MRGKTVGNLTNLNLSKGLLPVGNEALSLGLLVLEKLGPSGKDLRHVCWDHGKEVSDC